jgi:hypothetical protein
MSENGERKLSRKEAWITQIVAFILMFIIVSPGPIMVAMESLYRYQGMVYQYNKYEDIPGPSEIHVANIDLNMLRNGDSLMHCKGCVSHFPLS